MKLEAMKHQGKRTNLTSERAVLKSKARDILAQQAGEKSGMAITRYIALTKLTESLLQDVDEGKISVNCAADYLSTLSEKQQQDLKLVMTITGLLPNSKQMIELKELSRSGGWDEAQVKEILEEQNRSTVQITLRKKCLSQYFPKDYTQQKMEEIIFSLLETWKSQQKGAVPNDSDG